MISEIQKSQVEKSRILILDFFRLYFKFKLSEKIIWRELIKIFLDFDSYMNY